MSGPRDGRDLIKLLPTELVTKILDDLEPDEIVAASQACCRLRTISSAHDRFWHTCRMSSSINDPTYLRLERKRFAKRVRTLVALGLPIGIVLRFRYDTGSCPGDSDSEGDNDGGYDLLSLNEGVQDYAGLQTWRRPIRLAMSPDIAPCVANFELYLTDMYAELVHDDLVPAKMPRLRRLRLIFGVVSELPLPANLFSESAPQLHDLALAGVNVDVRSLANPSLLAFANVTTASLLEINLAFMPNIALYLPSVVHLTIGPALWYDLDDVRGLASEADYLQHKHITPFGTTLKALHLDCTEFFDSHFPSLPRHTAEERCVILAQLVCGLVPHLCTISMSRLSSAHVDRDVIFPVPELAAVLARSVQRFWTFSALGSQDEFA